VVLFGVSFFSGPVGGRAEGPSESDLGVSSLSRIIIEQKGSAFFEAVSEVQGGPNPPNMVYGVCFVISPSPLPTKPPVCGVGFLRDKTTAHQQF
jgi:hypothetical protein